MGGNVTNETYWIFSNKTDALSPDDQANDTSLDEDECENPLNIEEATFLRYVLIPSVILIGTLILLKQYRNCRHLGKVSKFSMIWPVDLIGRRHHRFSSVAAFSVSAWPILTLLTENDQLQIDSIPALRAPLKLLTTLVYAVIFYPIFGALSSQDAIGYTLGTLYTWMHAVLFFLLRLPCQKTLGERFLHFLPVLPFALWLLFLCIYFPYATARLLLKRRKGQISHQVQCTIVSMYCFHCQVELKQTFQYEYVHRLVNVKDKPPAPFMESIGTKGSILERITKFIFKRIYAPVEGYRYPISILTASIVSMDLVWFMSITILLMYNQLALQLRETIFGIYKMLHVSTAIDNLPNETGHFDGDLDETGMMTQASYWWTSLAVGLYVSLVGAIVLTVVSMLLALKHYRSHILRIYRGTHANLPCVKEKKPRTLVVASAKYVGYQLAYSFYGFCIYAILLLVVCWGLDIGIMLVFVHGQYDILYDLVAWLGPIVACIIVTLIIQQTLVHFVFLQKDDKGRKTLALRYLPWFYNFQYFMVFANSALGLVSCLLRLIKSIIIGAFTISRLDMSTMNRSFESMDNGFNAYVCLLAVENAQTNPTLLMFVHLLRECVQHDNNQEILPNKACEENGVTTKKLSINSKANPRFNLSPKRKIIRNRWLVALTLFNNPQLRFYRKTQTGEKFDIMDGLRKWLTLTKTNVDAETALAKLLAQANGSPL